MVSITTSYSHLGLQLAILMDFMDFCSLPKCRDCFKISQDYFLSHCFQFTFHHHPSIWHYTSNAVQKVSLNKPETNDLCRLTTIFTSWILLWQRWSLFSFLAPCMVPPRLSSSLCWKKRESRRMKFCSSCGNFCSWLLPAWSRASLFPSRGSCSSRVVSWFPFRNNHSSSFRSLQ